MSEKVDFGFETIDKDQKSARVEGVFSSVARNYDLMNDFMSGGVHRLWKDTFITHLSPKQGAKLLDVAGGTGDIAFRFLKEAGLKSHATVCDMTAAMLVEGQKRAQAQDFKNRIDWVQGDAMALPFADQSFDYYTISFGMRNVTDKNKALREAYRVLKYGGRMMVLEFSTLPNAWIQKLYDLYSFAVIPPLGQLVAGDRASYQYLVESIRKFPSQEKFSHMIREAGFDRVRYYNLTFGVAAIHSAWKI